ncbi:MAG: bacterial transcriptional activator domain-containing protein [bacterium]
MTATLIKYYRLSKRLLKVVPLWMALLLFPCISLSAQQDLPRRIKKDLLAGIHYTFKHEYIQADSVFSLLIKDFPDQPAGYLFKAGTIQTRIMDYEMEMLNGVMDSLLEQGTSLAKNWVDLQPSSAWGHYFLGTALGYESYARVYRDEWLGGVTKGLSAVSEFRKALELDSSLIDSYTGIGTFQYWRSRKTQIINWVPFIGNQADEGIKNLQRAFNDGLFTKYTAINNLLTILIDAERYEEAIDCALKGLSSYPENRGFLWGLATAYEREGEGAKAIDAYEKLLGALINDSEKNYYNEIVCRLNLSKLILAEKNREGVPAHLQRIIQLGNLLPAHLKKRGDSKIMEAQTLMNELLNKNRVKE